MKFILLANSVVKYKVWNSGDLEWCAVCIHMSHDLGTVTIFRLLGLEFGLGKGLGLGLWLRLGLGLE
jgi:hypothetical protein